VWSKRTCCSGVSSSAPSPVRPVREGVQLCPTFPEHLQRRVEFTLVLLHEAFFFGLLFVAALLSGLSQEFLSGPDEEHVGLRMDARIQSVGR